MGDQAVPTEEDEQHGGLGPEADGHGLARILHRPLLSCRARARGEGPWSRSTSPGRAPHTSASRPRDTPTSAAARTGASMLPGTHHKHASALYW